MEISTRLLGRSSATFARIALAVSHSGSNFIFSFFLFLGGSLLKDPSLSVVYRRGDDGQLFVFIYRGELHVGTVEVNSFNCVKIFRGIENSSPVLVQYLPRETA
jgi:hypothetical protein